MEEMFKRKRWAAAQECRLRSTSPVRRTGYRPHIGWKYCTWQSVPRVTYIDETVHVLRKKGGALSLGRQFFYLSLCTPWIRMPAPLITIQLCLHSRFLRITHLFFQSCEREREDEFNGRTSVPEISLYAIMSRVSGLRRHSIRRTPVL